MEKIVILDFDGVVTSCFEKPGSYMVNAGDSYGASPSCLQRLLKLVDETGAKVVISSNWRRFDDTGTCSFWNSPIHGVHANPLPKLKKILGSRYLCDLPKTRHIKKSQALKIWFDETGRDPEKTAHVIFDDDAGEDFGQSEFQAHFILTDYKTGLTDEDCAKAKEILGS